MAALYINVASERRKLVVQSSLECLGLFIIECDQTASTTPPKKNKK